MQIHPAILTLALVLCAVSVGCKSDKPVEEEGTPKATLSANPDQTKAAKAKKPPGERVADKDIATEEDFEEEAAESVTEDNLEKQLDTLSKEIGGE